MKNFFTISILFISFCVVAQPTINRDWIPSAGEELSNTSTSGITTASPGEDGANVSWDYSAGVANPFTSSGAIEFLTPSQTPYESSFQESNLASLVVEQTQNQEFYSFYRITDQTFENVGAESTLSKTTYTDVQTIMEFPFGFGDSFSDSFEGVTETQGVNVFFKGTSTTSADAFGTIITPSGNFNNILRIKIETQRVDSIAIGPDSYSLTELNSIGYVWLTSNFFENVANYNVSSGQSTSVIPGIDPSVVEILETASFGWTDLDPSTNTSDVVPIEFTYSPNPVSENLYLQFDNLDFEEIQISLLDITGQLISTSHYKQQSLNSEIQISVTDLPSGTYFVNVSNGKNNKVIKVFKE